MAITIANVSDIMATAEGRMQLVSDPDGPSLDITNGAGQTYPQRTYLLGPEQAAELAALTVAEQASIIATGRVSFQHGQSKRGATSRRAGSGLRARLAASGALNPDGTLPEPAKSAKSA